MGVPISFTWTEEITDPAYTPSPRTVTTVATMDSDALAAYCAARDPIEIDSFFPKWLAKALEIPTLQMVDAARDQLLAIPRYITPGDPPLSDSKGGLVAVHADGSVWRNGIRLGAAMTQKAMLYGDALFMKGKTVPSWWEWSGVTWIDRSSATLDPAIFI